MGSKQCTWNDDKHLGELKQCSSIFIVYHLFVATFLFSCLSSEIDRVTLSAIVPIYVCVLGG